MRSGMDNSGTMEYIDVSWLHKHVDEPVRMVSELDDVRFEVRKLEFYADGRVGMAVGVEEIQGTRLGGEPIPPLDEVNADPQFSGKYIAATEFEELWSAHYR